jgi:EAL domain-containing protein (putative c-di-GMP-specific phosphodiesterase class I)
MPLRHAGYTVVVDDLGAGEGGLMLLAEAAPAYIKAHGSIVRGLVDSPHKVRILEMISRFATGSRAQLIAEGVEREEEAAVLRQLGVPFLQGYLFGRPTEPSEVFGLPPTGSAVSLA